MLENGQVLAARFVLLRRLGTSRWGEVWLARESEGGREVALKILPDVWPSDPERTARFAGEARVLASLNHPNVGSIYGVQESDGVRALVLELVEGETLAERLMRRRLSIGEVTGHRLPGAVPSQRRQRRPHVSHDDRVERRLQPAVPLHPPQRVSKRFLTSDDPKRR